VQQSILSSTLSPGADELATELADSVQMIIQTLLQTSPPHILDPTREQLSGCALQIPTPSISALFTSMKTLSYMSKHIHAFNIPLGPSTPAPAEDDFDVGDLLQSVGDALSGLAAQTGVDLVIFHGDPTLRNLAVRTDECALIYALSYVSIQLFSDQTLLKS
jgi:osomolarity two-component system response regulator SSK1